MKNKLIKSFCLIFTLMFSINKVVYADTDISCEKFGNVKTDLQNFFNFFKILVPLLVIGLSTYDFIKAITQKDDKDIKKAFTRLMKRIACAVILFFLPVILNLLLDLIIENGNVCIN